MPWQLALLSADRTGPFAFFVVMDLLQHAAAEASTGHKHTKLHELAQACLRRVSTALFRKFGEATVMRAHWNTVTSTKRLCAAALVTSARGMLAKLSVAVKVATSQAGPQWEALTFMTEAAWDETPLKVKIQNLVGVAKIVQVTTAFHMLLKSPTQQLIIVSGTLPSPLSIVSRNTARCLLSAVRRQVCEPLPPDSAFKTKLRHVAADNFSANNLAEKVWADGNGGAWQHISRRCQLHKAASIASFVHELPQIASEVRGCLHSMLYLAHVGHSAAFSALFR